KHNSIGDNRRLSLIHVSRKPGRLERELPALLHHFERGNGAVHYRTMLDRIFELRMFWSPKRCQNPASSFGIFPTRHRSPHTRCSEVDVFIAKKRRAIERRAMVFAAKIFGVEEPDTAFLAGTHPQLPAFVSEDRRSDVEIEVALEHPLSIRRCIVILEFQLLRLRIHLHGHESLAIDFMLRIVESVPSSCINDSGRVDWWSRPAPHTSACGRISTDSVAGEIVGINDIGIAATSLSGMRVDYVLPEVQRVRFAVRRHE